MYAVKPLDIHSVNLCPSVLFEMVCCKHQAIVCNFCLTGNISIFKLFFLFIKIVLAIRFPLLEAIYLQMMQYKLAAAEAAVYSKCPPH